MSGFIKEPFTDLVQSIEAKSCFDEGIFGDDGFRAKEAGEFGGGRPEGLCRAVVVWEGEELIFGVFGARSFSEVVGVVDSRDELDASVCSFKRETGFHGFIPEYGLSEG